MIGNEHGASCGRVDQGQTRDVQGSEEAAFPRGHRREVAVTVAFQPETVTRVGSGGVGLRLVQISRHEQIEIAVPVDVVRNDPLDR